MEGEERSGGLQFSWLGQLPYPVVGGAPRLAGLIRVCGGLHQEQNHPHIGSCSGFTGFNLTN